MRDNVRDTPPSDSARSAIGGLCRHTCWACGQSCWSTRRDALTCSAGCRQARRRIRRAAALATEEMERQRHAARRQRQQEHDNSSQR